MARFSKQIKMYCFFFLLDLIQVCYLHLDLIWVKHKGDIK